MLILFLLFKFVPLHIKLTGKEQASEILGPTLNPYYNTLPGLVPSPSLSPSGSQLCVAAGVLCHFLTS